MIHKIHLCVWFDKEAKQAAELYCSVFSNSKITVSTPMVTNFELDGNKFMGLNGGPVFKVNPSISIFVSLETEAEVKAAYEKLSVGGSALMPLGKYPWNDCYAWIKDQFGLTWQLMKGVVPPGASKFTPSFLFSDKQYGKGEEAIKFYTALFPESSIENLELYGDGEAQNKGKLKFSRFNLHNTDFIAMDGPGNHEFNFNEGLSLVLECDTQEEIDFYWDNLTKEGSESQCGWLKDKFGVSWQIIPKILGKLMSDSEKAPRVMQAFLKMKKFDIETLLKA